jgi:hypothetical protein
LGYDHSFGTRVLTGISFEKNFFYKKSPSVRGGIQQSIEAYLYIKGEFLEPKFSFTSNKGAAFTDAVINLSLDHNFHFKENRLNVITGMSMNYGSRNYYDAYLNSRAKNFDARHVNTPIVTDAGENKPLDLEIAVDVTYRSNNWLYTFRPTWAIPFSAATVSGPKGLIKETLSNSLFLELDICYRHERR